MTRTSASAAHDIARGSDSVQILHAGRTEVPSDATSSEHAVHTPAQYPHPQHFPNSSSTPTVHVTSLARATLLACVLVPALLTPKPQLHYSPRRRCLTIPRHSSTSCMMLLKYSHLPSPSLLHSLNVQIIHIDRFDPRLVVRVDIYSSSVGIDDFIF
ncbi:hypothetical protein PIB30_078102 [Stylosanthes scabra]|uniref:Uncharacterized protein n=1 Tax=Stylosanthes scabra TaxID=79078 RepID=A0ABU6URH2_9FABA|nr:hypothetical protein [Stylosanthes scabra]